MRWNAPPNLAPEAATALRLIRPVALPSTNSALPLYRKGPARPASVVSAPPSRASSPPTPLEEQPAPYRLPEPFSSKQRVRIAQRSEDGLIWELNHGKRNELPKPKNIP